MLAARSQELEADPRPPPGPPASGGCPLGGSLGWPNPDPRFVILSDQELAVILSDQKLAVILSERSASKDLRLFLAPYQDTSSKPGSPKTGFRLWGGKPALSGDRGSDRSRTGTCFCLLRGSHTTTLKCPEPALSAAEGSRFWDMGYQEPIPTGLASGHELTHAETHRSATRRERGASAPRIPPHPFLRNRVRGAAAIKTRPPRRISAARVGPVLKADS